MPRKAEGARVFKIPNSPYFYMEYVEDNRILIPRQSLRTKNYKEALRSMRRIVDEFFARGLAREEDGITRFRDVATAYLEEDISDLAYSTQRDRQRHLRPGALVDRTLGNIPIGEFTPATIRDWWSENIRSSPSRGDKTGNNYLNAISAVVQRAIEYEFLESDPIAAFLAVQKRRKRRTKKFREETEAGGNVNAIENMGEVERILVEARREGLIHHVHILLMLDAGLRMGEAIALRWGKIYWGEDENDLSRHLMIDESNPRGAGNIERPKSGRKRRVGLSRRLRRALLELQREQFKPGPDQFIVTHRQDMWRRKHWRRILERARTGYRKPKDLRDTFASQLLTAGNDLAEISHQLGHSAVSTTEGHYAKWIEREEYRAPTLPGAGEIPADVLERLGRQDKRKVNVKSADFGVGENPDSDGNLVDLQVLSGAACRGRTDDRRVKRTLSPDVGGSDAQYGPPAPPIDPDWQG